MGRQFILCIFVTALLLVVGCDTEKRPAGMELKESAAALDAEFDRVRAAAVDLAAAAADRFADPARYAEQRFPERRYRTFEGSMTYYQGEPDESAALLVQSIPAGDAAMGELRLLEHLDGALRQVVAASPLVAMAWVATGRSAAVFFPPFDLVAYVPTEIDVALDILPYRAAAPVNNPGRVPVWVEPYVDIVGTGYMVTVSVPIYREADMVAVAGANLAVEDVARCFLGGGEEELRLLLTSSGFLAGATGPAGRALGIEALGRFYYLNPMQSQSPAPERLNLTRHANVAVRELTTRVLAGEESFSLSASGRSYRVESAGVSAAGWHLVQLLGAQ